MDKEDRFFFNPLDGKECCEWCYKKFVPLKDRAKIAIFQITVRFESWLRGFRNKVVFGRT